MSEKESADLSARTEDGGGILCIRNPDTHRGWNGIRYKTGMSAKNVGAQKLSMNVATVPPGAVAYAHITSRQHGVLLGEILKYFFDRNAQRRSTFP